MHGVYLSSSPGVPVHFIALAPGGCGRDGHGCDGGGGYGSDCSSGGGDGCSGVKMHRG